mmetsp:Transcript_11200/g.27543  ORF Transcript_11200/g.27543 Transcript_11200/m.27543 type:complete len:83 (+) Transcript_11200:1018-1266(+)
MVSYALKDFLNVRLIPDERTDADVGRVAGDDTFQRVLVQAVGDVDGMHLVMHGMTSQIGDDAREPQGQRRVLGTDPVEPDKS